jgi:hypothetical protein
MSAKHVSQLFAYATLGAIGVSALAGGCSDNGARPTTDTVPDAMTDTGSSSGSTSSSSSSGSSSSGGSSGSGGGDASDAAPSDGPGVTMDGPAGACSLPSPLPANGLVYNGGVPAQVCPQTLDTVNYPNNSWFSYNDGTSDGGTFVHTAQKGGCDGANDCAFHASGSGYTGYGAGVGLTLNNNAIFDATAKGYMGLQVWLKGTTTGTRGTGYAKRDNTVHVKFLTGNVDGSMADPRNGDDYGYYCSTQDADGGTGGWVVCPIPFASLMRDGFRNADSGAPNPGTDMFDPQNLVKIQFEFSAYTPPAEAGIQDVVGFDVWIDNVAFF